MKLAPQVASVSDPFQSGAVNKAGTVGFAQAVYRLPAGELTDDGPRRPDRHRRCGAQRRPDGRGGR